MCGERRLELGGERPKLGIWVERGVDRLRHPLGQLGADRGEGCDWLSDRSGGCGRALADQRVLAAEALIERQGERVDIGRGPGPEPVGLLGCHVGERADDGARCRQRPLAGDAGDPEVDELRLVTGADEDVLGLDVAVDNAGAVGMGQRRGRVRADLCDEAVRQLSAAPEAAQGLALDQLGDEERPLPIAGELVQRRDVAVREAGHRLRLPGHPGGAVLAVDHLDRDRPLQPFIPGAIDGAEAAASDPALYPESAQDYFTDHGASIVRCLTASSCAIRLRHQTRLSAAAPT